MFTNNDENPRIHTGIIGDGDGDVKLFPDVEGGWDRDESGKRGWGWEIRSPKSLNPLPSLVNV